MEYIRDVEENIKPLHPSNYLRSEATHDGMAENNASINTTTKAKQWNGVYDHVDSVGILMKNVLNLRVSRYECSVGPYISGGHNLVGNTPIDRSETRYVRRGIDI